MQSIIKQKIKILELAVKNNQVEQVETLLKEDLQLVEQLMNGNTEILLILANHSNVYIKFKSQYQSMMELLAKYRINTFRVNGENLASNNNLFEEIIKYIDQYKIKYRTLLEQVAFFILDNNISYKQEEATISNNTPRFFP